MLNRFAFENLPLTGVEANKAWKLASIGATLGVFQLDGNLGQKYCKLIKPKSVAEIAYITSLIRPGCLDAGVSESFVKRRNGQEKIEPIHSKLTGILDPTQGYWLFQEDLVRAVCHITGWDQVAGDLLRIACAKKLPEEMAKLKLKFAQSCLEHSNIPNNESDQIFDIIEKSQRYLFNLNHATLYSAMSYVDLYLKAVYPHIFYCSNLTLAHKGAEKWDSVRDLIVDARRFGIQFLPPTLKDLNETFSVIRNNNNDNWNIRVGFANLKGLGKSHIKVVKKLVGITSWKNFLLKALTSSGEDNIRKDVTEILIKSGCLDYLGVSRDVMLWEFNLLWQLTPVELRYIEQRLKENDNFCLKTLLEGLLVNNIPIRGRPDKIRTLMARIDIIPLLPSVRNSHYERDTIGTAVTEKYTSQYNCSETTHDCSSFYHSNDGDIVSVAGMIDSVFNMRDKKNNEYVRWVLCDGYGSIACLMFSSVYKEYLNSNLLEDGAMVVVTGKRSDEAILINSVEALS